MPKFAATLLVIHSLLIVTLSAPANAQPRSNPDDEKVVRADRRVEPAAVPAEKAPELKGPKKKVDFKRVIDDETKKFKAESGKFDPVKLELEKAKQAQKKGWSTTEKTVLVVFAVGIAVLVWFVIKYGKECVETSPPGCSLYGNTDEFCTCERYKDEDAGRGAAR